MRGRSPPPSRRPRRYSPVSSSVKSLGAERNLEFRLQPLEPAALLPVSVNRQAVLLGAGRRQVDVVVVAGRERAQFAADCLAIEAKPEFARNAALGVEVRVTDLELLRGNVRPVRVELGRARVTLAARQLRDQCEPLAEIADAAERELTAFSS